jgi:hypothetical protein
MPYGKRPFAVTPLMQAMATRLVGRRADPELQDSGPSAVVPPPHARDVQRARGLPYNHTVLLDNFCHIRLSDEIVS